MCKEAGTQKKDERMFSSHIKRPFKWLEQHRVGVRAKNSRSGLYKRTMDKDKRNTHCDKTCAVTG